VKDAASVAAIGLMPVELNVRSLYEDLDRRRRKSGNEKSAGPQLQVCNGYTPIYNKANESTSVDALRIERHSRISRKEEKYIQDLEDKLTGFQGQHSAITQLYESLQLAYSSVTEELETLRRRNRKQEDESPAMRSHYTSAKEWEESHMEISNALLFNDSP
jgi:septation ring formation regulator EzrA